MCKTIVQSSKKKVAMKASRDILTASYLIALLDFSNENTDYLFD